MAWEGGRGREREIALDGLEDEEDDIEGEEDFRAGAGEGDGFLMLKAVADEGEAEATRVGG